MPRVIFMRMSTATIIWSPSGTARVVEEFAAGKAAWVAGNVRTVQAGQPDGLIRPQPETCLLDWFSTNPIPAAGLLLGCAS